MKTWVGSDSTFGKVKVTFDGKQIILEVTRFLHLHHKGWSKIKENQFARRCGKCPKGIKFENTIMQLKNDDTIDFFVELINPVLSKKRGEDGVLFRLFDAF